MACHAVNKPCGNDHRDPKMRLGSAHLHTDGLRPGAVDEMKNWSCISHNATSEHKGWAKAGRSTG